jgi:hypothetical protein
MTDWPSLFAKGETLVRSIVPELANVPIYFVAQIGSPFENSQPAAMTGPRVDLMLKEHLGERYAGRGIAVVFNTLFIEAFWQDIWAWLKPAIIHELSHAIADGWAFSRDRERDDYPPEKVANLTKSTADFAAAGPWWEDHEDGLATYTEFLSHNDRWIRCACHLATRAGTPIFDVIGDRSEISNPVAYLACLRPEVYDFFRLPILEVLGSRAPDAFNSLWQRDCVNFHAQKEAQKKARQGAVSSSIVSDSEKETIMSSSILEKVLSAVTGRVREKNLSAVQRFTALAKQIADGREPGIDQVEEILEAAHKTPADLESGVNAILQRRQLQQTVNRAKGVSAERAKLDQQFAAAKEAFEAAQAIWDAAWPPIQNRQAELDDIDRQAEAARGQLTATCQDETLLKEMADLRNERQELNKRRHELETKRNTAGTSINNAEIAAGKTAGASDGRLQRDGERWLAEKFANAAPLEKKVLAEIEGNLAELGKVQEALQQREAGLREKMALAAV